MKEEVTDIALQANALRLGRDFFARPTQIVARELIGAILYARRRGGEMLAARIVETEAYLSEGDAASHSFRGKTARNAAMFGEPGTLYVYKIYGVHLCANIVTEEAGRGAAALLRAAEPLQGLAEMRARRNVDDALKLCRGPGNFCRAFGWTLQDNGLSLVAETSPEDAREELFAVFAPPFSENGGVEIAQSPRIGISQAADVPLRFFARGSPFVSRTRSKVVV